MSTSWCDELGITARSYLDRLRVPISHDGRHFSRSYRPQMVME